MAEHSAEYVRYLASPEWALFRQMYYQRHSRACLACGATRFVDLHHVTYERLGHEWDEDLTTLCRFCHEAVHHAHQQGKRRTLAAVTWGYINGRARRERSRVLPVWAVSGERRAKRDVRLRGRKRKFEAGAKARRALDRNARVLGITGSGRQPRA